MDKLIEILSHPLFGLAFSVITFYIGYRAGKSTEKKFINEIQTQKTENEKLHQKNLLLAQESNRLSASLNSKMDIDREIDTTPLEQIFEKVDALNIEGKSFLADQYLERLSFNNRILKTSEYWHGLGILKVNKNQLADGLVFLKKAEELDTAKSDYELYSEIGRTYTSLILFDNAIIYYEKALAIKPDYTHSLLGKAIYYLYKNNTTKAEEICNELEEKGVINSDLFMLRGNLLVEQRKLVEAIPYFQNAIKYRIIKEPVVYINLAFCNFYTGNIDAAFKTLDEGLRFLPNEVSLTFQKANFYLLLQGDNLVDAINIYESFPEKINERIRNLNNYSVALFQIGHYKKVTERFSKLDDLKKLPSIDNELTIMMPKFESPIHSDPNYLFINYLNLVGLCYFNIQEYEKAMNLYKRANSIHKNDLTYTNISKLLIDIPEFRDLDLAEFYIKEALELNPNNADLYNNYGFLLKEKGAKENAKAKFLKALELNPNHILAKGNLEALLIAE